MNSKVRRFFDVVVSFCLLVLCSPVLAVIAIIVRWTSDGPIVFRQKRIGFRGTPFELLKFRSMFVDADLRRNDLVLDGMSRNENGVTPCGAFLRAHKLDELLNFWNVFRGDMSIVGPRPLMPEEVQGLTLMVPNFEDRFLVRPGITSHAKLLSLGIGKSLVRDITEAEIEVHYVRGGPSILSDLWTFGKTAIVPFRRSC